MTDTGLTPGSGSTGMVTPPHTDDCSASLADTRCAGVRCAGGPRAARPQGRPGSSVKLATVVQTMQRRAVSICRGSPGRMSLGCRALACPRRHQTTAFLRSRYVPSSPCTSPEVPGSPPNQQPAIIPAEVGTSKWEPADLDRLCPDVHARDVMRHCAGHIHISESSTDSNLIGDASRAGTGGCLTIRLETVHVGSSNAGPAGATASSSVPTGRLLAARR